MVTFPLALKFELQLAGVWTDITTDVYQRDPVTITRGRSGEGSQTEPSRCNLTINNASGDYSPRNPTGAHFGKLGRNTPLRVTAGASDVRFVGEVASWPQRWDPSEADVWVPVEAAGIMRRLGQGQAPLNSVYYRRTVRLADVVAYWPCEDGEDATELASAFPGHPPMSFSGDVDLASFTGFKASSPIPTASGKQWTGQVPSYTDTGVVLARFLMAVPAAGVASTATICRVVTEGTASRWEVRIDTSGNIQIRVTDAEGALLQDTGFFNFASGSMNGRLFRMSLELRQDAGDADWELVAWEVGVTSYVTGGSVIASTIGRAMAVGMNVGGVMEDVALGHVTVERAEGGAFLPDDEVAAYVGEAAGTRIQRLCAEEGITFSSVGTLADTTPMGPQLPKTLLELLREAEAADLGVLYEPRTALGLEYRTRDSLYSQASDLALDYATADLSSIEPVDDDQATRNDVTAKRDGGASARAVDDDGPLGVDTVGRYDEEVTISVEKDGDLPDQASWRLHLGTVDEARYPVLGVNLATEAFTSDAALSTAAAALNIGDKVTVDNPPAWLPPEDISQLAQGMTETLSPFEWRIDINCAPESPWDVGIWDDSTGPGEARYSSDGSTLAEDLTTTETDVDVATPSGPLWTGADQPFDIYVGGERMTVTAIAGATSPQTFTVTRSVNGVVKTHLTGAEVRLFKPAYYAL